MTELDYFQRLKEKVLLKYQEQYPFFQGNWKTFSSQDIQNLIGLIEVQCKQTISEKWIYTHLKPESNSKIPRKDMLNILSEFVGYSGWDEFIFEDKAIVVESKPSSETKKSKNGIVLLGFILTIGIIGFIIYSKNNKPDSQTIELQNEFTNEKVNSEEVKVYQVSDSTKTELKVKEGKVQVVSPSDKTTQIVIQSPYYQPKTITIDPKVPVVNPVQRIDLKPDDYAMMLKAFMVSDIKNWQTRKEQLNQILSDNLEVIVMLKDDLGAEFFNKNEFSQKLIVPSESLKKMKIVEIKNDDSNKIQFIRIKQE
jgi:preprotein translocase subunit Sss1